MAQQQCASYVALAKVCAQDGSPIQQFFTNAQGLRVCLYTWQPTSRERKPRGAVLLIHGITSHARFEYLQHNGLAESDAAWCKEMANYYGNPDTSPETLNLPTDDTTKNGENFERPGIRSLYFSNTGRLTLFENDDAAKASGFRSVSFKSRTTLPEKAQTSYGLQYTDSWVEAWVQRGFIVYALDIQSHGLSDGWMGERCNFEAFDNVAYDVIQAFQYVKNNAQFQHDCSVNSSKLPLFGVGISFGGAVLARAMELASQQSLLPPTAITGIVLLAPALALDTVAQQGIHACAAPFAGLISSAFPRVKVFAPIRNLQFDYINQLVALDPLTYTQRLPVRNAVEILQSVPKVQQDAPTIFPTVSILICHSVCDTLCDTAGSKKFYDHLTLNDKHLWLIHGMWHFLTKEPGSKDLLQYVLKWCETRTSSPVAV